MTKTLKDNDKVEISGFGSFTFKNDRSYISRNPKPGESIGVKRKRLPAFKVGI